jgi:hypothetical protein
VKTRIIARFFAVFGPTHCGLQKFHAREGHRRNQSGAGR